MAGPRAQLPLAQRIVQARFKAALLLVMLTSSQFDELDAAIGDDLLHNGTKLEETAVLLPRAEPHDIFYPGAVVQLRSR